MRTIAIVNQKGGCGKTTTAINLAAVFANRGLRTLLIDMDPQSHCAAGLGVPESRIEVGIGEALLADHDLPAANSNLLCPLIPGLLWEVARDLHLAPSTTRLAALEAPGGGLHQLPDRDRRLESLLKTFAGRFDICLIDCPPTIGLLTFNALRAAREVLVPVETGFFSLKGAHKQWATIQRTIDRIGRPIICHMLPTLHDPASSIARDILSSLHRDFAGQIVPTVIHEHETLREAASFGQPVVEYAPASEATRDFERLADWLQEQAARLPEIEVIRHDATGFRQEPASSRVADQLSRAAELAHRVRELASRHERNEPMPMDSPWERKGGANDQHEFEHVFGVTQMGRAILFAQPGSGAISMAVAGDFNNWSPAATPLRYNEETDTFETLLEIPPGAYRYRLLVDGIWKSDPYNAPREHALAFAGRENAVMDHSGANDEFSVLVVE